jgi:peptidoglycan/xylan/chitin deacetylase (PgdA/CDA1 family)
MVCALLGTSLLGSAGATSGAARRDRLTVVVEGVPTRLPLGRATAAQALVRAGIVPRDGALLSAATGTVLDPLHDHGYVLVNGRPASMDTRLRKGWRVDVHDGTDVSEATDVRQVVLPYDNQDKVGQPGWLPGSEGLADETYGVVSGEVVTRTVLEAPVAAVEVKVTAVTAGSSVFLTFDDGPDPTWTPQVLDVLAKHGVKATFCMVGRYARANPGLVQRVVAEGHALCNHTENHAALDTLSADAVEAEIAAAQSSIQAAAGRAPGVFRIPYGRGSATVSAVAGTLGLSILGWNVDPSDYARPGTEQLVARVSQAVRPGAIVLLHDGGSDRSQTVAALDRLIPMLKDAGYSFGRP